MPIRQADAELWEGEHAYATTLVALLLDRVQPDEGEGDDDGPLALCDWDPAAIHAEIVDTWGVRPHVVTFHRALMGLAFLCTPRRFRENAAAFIDMCNVFCGSAFNPTAFDPADAFECAWGLTESLLLSPPGRDQGDDIFGPEVRAYVGTVVANEGFISPPDVLRIGEGTANRALVSSLSREEQTAAIEEDRRRSAEITTALDEGVARLLSQLEGLSLRRGDAKRLRERILAAE